MGLTAGTRLGPYEIVAPLGAGGMGEVYRARDTKLNRDVALKILPDVFAGDPDRLARFTREAETLASLNHPNIAHVYDAGKPDASSSHAYLVMELVDGEDLSTLISAGHGTPEAESPGSRPRDTNARQARGGGAPRGLNIDDALAIARQIADALEAAHDQGIIHRDLKPANVKVRADGTVKVLDFGLAKALDAGSKDPASMDHSANSPTLTGRATQLGMIIGTAAYMAPEQARGRAVDRRADVWAFGVVLYEMLAGRRAFDGDDISITLASVLKEDVDWNALPGDLPTPVRRLLRRCLEKDPKRRLSAIADARLELDEAIAGADRDLAAVAPPSAPVVLVPAWRRALPWVIATIGIAAAVATLLIWAPWRPVPSPAPRRLFVGLGAADTSLQVAFGASVVLSPDGTSLVFVGQQANGIRLFLRKLDQLQASPLAGTEGASGPFFSPNGESIAFFAAGRLKRVAVTGGAVLTLCSAASGRGGTWTDNDEIIFSPSSAPNVSLVKVSASGGKEPAPFGVLASGVLTQRWPQALPGGSGVLYTEHSSTSGFDQANLAVAPTAGGPGKIVVRGGYHGRFVASGSAAPNRADRRGGHLLYMQQGTLFAVRFDLDRLETVGEARPAIEGVASNPVPGGAQVDVSADGTVVYVPGATGANTNPVDWMTRDGKTSALRTTKADWVQPRFSPDGTRLALTIDDGKQRDVWVYDWTRDNLSQLTLDATAADSNAVWTPDSKRIVFASDRDKAGIANLYWTNSDGTGQVTRLTDSPNTQAPWSFDPSGKFLTFQEVRSGTGIDLMILPLEGDATRGWTPGTPKVFLGTPATEVNPMFSPDGRWIAYFSNESGNSVMDVYVRPFPGPGGPWRVSNDGGTFPRWSRASQELLYLNNGKVMVAPYRIVGDAFQRDKPQVWSPTGFVGLGTANPYDLHPDGKRLAIIAARDQAEAVQNQFVMITNFFEYLWKIAPGRK